MGYVCLALIFACQGGETQVSEQIRFYVGTGTRAEDAAGGIFTCEFDPGTGAISTTGHHAGIMQSTFLAISPDKKILYTVNETDDFGGEKSGAFSAYRIESETGNLEFLNQLSSGGSWPCHISTDRSGKVVLVANYGGGSALSAATGKDGSLEKIASFMQHEGASINKERQEVPHAHQIIMDPTDTYVYVCDLGLDKIVIYRLNKATGALEPNDPPFIEVVPGSGPRHMTFHPNGKYAYVINELNATIIVFNFDPSSGRLEAIQNISTLPPSYDTHKQCADIHVHPSGKFLYGSNRGHDTIAIFRIDRETGKLSVVGHQGEHIVWPRNFAIAPGGRFLLVANQNSNDVVSFAIDQETGDLTPTGHSLEIPRPMCIKFIRRS